MTDAEKSERIAVYREVLDQFGKLTIPSEDTPTVIANSLIETYNRYKEWLETEGQIADSQGWYSELVG